MSRPSFALAAAASILPWALRSEDENTKTSCIILNHDNQVISIGFNGIKAGLDIKKLNIQSRDEKLTYFIHGETNALSLIKKGEGKTLITLVSPCASCAQNIAAHNIKEVYYIKEYHRCSKFKDIFKQYGIKYEKLDEKDVWEVLDNSSRLLE